MSNAEFKRNFAKVLEKAGAKAEMVVRAAGMELLKRVIEKSPVGDPSMWKNPESAPKGYVGGRFKANWNVAIGSVDHAIDAPPDESGASSIGRGSRVVMSFPLGAVVFITNSMPYSKRIEYDAWSKQATAGVVRITVLEYKEIIKQVAAQIK
nr:hypothetical protein [uncultured Undibacterium sp.]